jgi:hypothetical protein
MENGRDIWELKCKKSVYVSNTQDNCRELPMYLSGVVTVQNVRMDKGRAIFFLRNLE